LGQSIVFDTVGKLGWYVDVRTHVIKAVIMRLLEDEEIDWGDPEEERGGDDGNDRNWWTRLKKGLRSTWKRMKGTVDVGEIQKRRDVPKSSVEEDCVVSSI
jgi:hypothetical protein